jgi:hypothetical protein
MIEMHRLQQKPYARSSGFALIISLLMITALAVLVLAFFARSTGERKLVHSNVSVQQSKLLCDFTRDELIRSLRQEIAAGSILIPNPHDSANWEQTLFRPKSASTAFPTRSGSSPNLPNLLKRSNATEAFFHGADFDTALFPAPARASNISSATPSLNGRYVDFESWNKPGLMNEADFTSAGILPQWMLLGRQGFLDADAANLNEYANPASEQFVIGRAAFMIYDVSGLLDINAAGNQVSGSRNQAGGRLHRADLSLIPGVLDAERLLEWRAPESAEDASQLDAPDTAFIDPLPGDERFLNRQDLLTYIKNNPDVLSNDVLPYVTVFSRTHNVPRWMPEVDGSNQIFPLPTNQNDRAARNKEYKTHAIADRSNPSLYTRNPDVLAIRRQYDATWTTPEGEVVNARAGDPIMRKRFDLSKLALFDEYEANPNDASVLAAIRYYFGLLPANEPGLWDYDVVTSSGGGHWRVINTLARVAALPANQARDPNFFEILQAAILHGSLAHTRTRPDTGNYSGTNLENSVAIFQIGANIIDQYDTNSFPTGIRARNAANVTLLNDHNSRIYGAENLPYMSELLGWIYRPESDLQRLTVKGMWIPEVWNPHRNAAEAEGLPIRLVWASGGVQYQMHKIYSEFTEPVDIADSDNTKPAFTFTNGPHFRNAVLLAHDTPGLLSAPPDGIFTEGGFTLAGFPLRDRDVDPEIWEWNEALQKMVFVGIRKEATFHAEAARPRFKMQVQDSNGIWRTYQFFDISTTENRFSIKSHEAPAGYDTSPNSNTSQASFTARNYMGNVSTGIPDPRTFILSKPFLIASPNLSMRPNADASDPGYVAFAHYFHHANMTHPVHPTYNWHLDIFTGLYADNRNLSSNDSGKNVWPWYRDPDGIHRLGDGAHGAFPLATAPTPDSEIMKGRPVILNRPFRSLGDLGFVFRGTPWRSIDLASENSPEQGVLDFFTLSENKVTAGVLNPNTPHAPVLASLFSGLSGGPVDSPEISLYLDNNTITDDAATALANAWVTTTQIEPIKTAAETVSHGGGKTTVLSALPTSFQSIKSYRETPIRALADVSNTNTWNLLVDIVVQVGRYPANQTDLKDFNVESSRRVWVHLAIDRFTGKVIDSIEEVVYE